MRFSLNLPGEENLVANNERLSDTTLLSYTSPLEIRADLPEM